MMTAPGPRASGQPFSPKAIAYGACPRAAAFVFLRGKFTAEDRLYAQGAEKSRGDFFAGQMFRRPGTCKVPVLRIECRHLLERASIVLPIEKVRVGDGDCV